MKFNFEIPRLFHIGMPKSGSSFLYTLLKQHPRICLGKVQKINFYGHNFIRGREWYRDLFDFNGSDCVPVDTSPKLFLHGAEAARRIKQAVSEPKFLLIVRNPIKYVYSHYRMHFNNGFFLKKSGDLFRKNPSFNEIIEKFPQYLERGKYFENFRIWLKYHDLSRFQVVVFENFVREPQIYMDRIYDFFQLDRIEIKPVREASKNVAMKSPFFYKIKRSFVRHEKLKNLLKEFHYLDRAFDMLFSRQSRLPDEYRSILSEFYRRDIAELSKLTDLDLNFWLEDF